MKILVTGATGFVGQWLIRELASVGHDPVGTPSSHVLDITELDAVTSFVRVVRPEAVVHLAGMAYGPDARREPERAMEVNAGGTRTLMEAVGALHRQVPILLVSSSEVYGSPESTDLPLRESAPLRADQPYGLSKVSQERVALEAAESLRIPTIVVRPFNHTGPGQRPQFVIPALAGRIVAARAGTHRTIQAGNVDVRRDFSDVRDVVRAYRLLIEGAVNHRLPSEHVIYNVASGRSVAIREMIHRLAKLAGMEIEIAIDPALVRPQDAPEVRGDASRLAADVGWHPTTELDTTLADILRDVESRALLDSV